MKSRLWIVLIGAVGAWATTAAAQPPAEETTAAEETPAAEETTAEETAEPEPEPEPEPVVTTPAPAPAPVSPVASEPGTTVINANYGSLTVMGIFQALLEAKFDGSNIDRRGPPADPAGPNPAWDPLALDGEINDWDDAYANDHFDFWLQRARLILKGHLISPNLTYVFQGDATSNPSGQIPFMLDAKIGYAIPEAEGYTTTISAGRFLPPFTLILPRLVSRLDSINYPLYLFDTYPSNVNGSETRQPFAASATVGRQVGFLITQTLTPMAQLDIGVFNGLQRSFVGRGWADDNDWKDIFFRAQVKPMDGLMLAVDFWAGFPNSLRLAAPRRGTTAATLQTFAISNDDPDLENDESYYGVLEAEFTMVPNLKLMGEFVYNYQLTRTQVLDTTTSTYAPTSEQTRHGLGGWFHVGYTFKDLLGEGASMEIMGRMDVFDPDIDKANTTRLQWTLGPQFFLEGIHSQIRLNYVFGQSDYPNAADPMLADMRHMILLQAAIEL